jgi:hypothetical protein
LRICELGKNSGPFTDPLNKLRRSEDVVSGTDDERAAGVASGAVWSQATKWPDAHAGTE